ncbi:MAG: carboxylesterase/lipase family protein, partial [Acidimicrobiia bacterium]
MGTESMHAERSDFADDRVVTVSSGSLRGERFDGGLVLRGIPYASPPVGPRRFRPPEPAEAWSGVRDATAYGDIARQMATPLEALNGNDLRAQSEDCLSLNVWTPACDGGRRPVMVWIHGGAFLTGSGATPTFDGSSFAREHDIVVLTINYRLNVFGFLHLGGIDPSEVGSGNCGLLDQIAALEWVKENISRLGGDPANVTLFGESAGAMSVGILLATPAARGLFRKAILQSGAASSTVDLETAQHAAEQLLARLGLSTDADPIASLRALPADDVLAAYVDTVRHLSASIPPERAGFLFAPVVDGAVLPVDPLTALRQGASSDVAVMIGTNADEMEVMRIQIETFYAFDDDETQRRFESVFGAYAGEAAGLYEAVVAGTPHHRWTAVDSDKGFFMPAVRLAEARWEHSDDTWMYLFAWPTTAFDGRLGSYHTLEIPFVFNSLDRGAAPRVTDGPPEAARQLALRMHAAWARFARSGEPGSD